MNAMMCGLAIFSAIGIAGTPAAATGIAGTPQAAAGAAVPPAAEAQSQAPPSPSEKQLYVVSTAHLDTQWRWTIQNTINEYIPKTMRENFDLFEKYPDYVFTFEGAFRYMLMKEYYPAEYDLVRHYIRDGRWKVGGSWVDAVDTNIPSPESLIRHALLGNGFFRREFGVTSRDVFLPDCFGFGYALPSIASHCGLTGFSTQKLTWGSAIGVPFDIGVWEGVDGSRVFAALNPGAYVSEAKDDLSADSAVVATVNKDGAASGLYAAYKYIGTGDQGGAPTDSSVLWLEESIRKPKGDVHVRSAASDQLARDLSAMPGEVAAQLRLPHYRGELVMTRHGSGCYTSEAAMKRWNRKNERLADAAERASVVADWLGAVPYPRETLDQAWTRFLWHQFHDDLTGTSIPKAYTFSWNDEAISQNQFAGVLETAVGAVTRALDTRAKGIPVVVYNPLSFERVDAVDAAVVFPGEGPQAIRVIGPDGVDASAQATVDPDGHTVHATFLAKVPSVGFAVYDIQPAAAGARGGAGAAPAKGETPKDTKGKGGKGGAGAGAPAMDLVVTDSTLANSRYRVRIDKAGDIAQVTDIRNKVDLLSAPIRLEMLNDNPTNWAAWEINYSDVPAVPREYVGGPPEIKVVENGPARGAIEIIRHTAGSTFRQQIRLAAGDAGDRIEIVNEVDWRSPATLLKAAFPLAVSSDSATYDLGLGTIRRPTNTEKKYEVPAQEWADLTGTDGRYGVAVMNDCKYAWDKPDDHTLRLTLIHTPGVNANWQWIDDQASMDLGGHHFTFAICGHAGDWRGQVTPVADRLNQPLIAFQAPATSAALAGSANPATPGTTPAPRAAAPAPGPLGRSFSLLHAGNPAVIVRAVKRAQDSDEYIVRMEETTGRAAPGVKLIAAEPIVSAHEVNGAEEEVGPCDVQDGALVADFRAYQPRSFAIRLAYFPTKHEPGELPPPVLTRPSTKAVSLPYNMVGFTQLGHAGTADFDGSGRTMPGDLLPATITCQGIPFATGPCKPAGAAEENVVQCEGQKLDLPAGNYNRLYILAAAVGGDRLAHFQIGELLFDLSIQDAEEPIAQWNSRVAGPDLITDPALIQPAYTKPDRIAWVGTHRNKQDGGYDAYEFFYLYKYEINMPMGARTVTLPSDPAIRIAAMTVASDPNSDTHLAQTLIDRSTATLVRIDAPGPQFLDPIRVALHSPMGGAVIRYTTDGSEPAETSPVYTEPIAVDATTTIRGRAFLAGMDDRFVASETFTKLRIHDALRAPKTLKPGIEVRYYEGTWTKVPPFTGLKARKVDMVPTVKIPSFARAENFALKLSGFIRIPADGMYTFHLSSDDGSILYLGPEKVVDNDGPHGETERTGAVALRAGVHPIRIEYYQGVGDAALSLQVEGPGIPLGPVSKEMLGH